MYAIATSSLPPNPQLNSYLAVPGANLQPAWQVAGTQSVAAAASNGSTYIASKGTGSGGMPTTGVFPTQTIVFLLKTAQHNRDIFGWGGAFGGRYSIFRLGPTTPCMQISAGVVSAGTYFGFGANASVALDDNNWHLLVAQTYISGGTNTAQSWVDNTTGGPVTFSRSLLPDGYYGGTVIGSQNDNSNGNVILPTTGDFSRWAFWADIQLTPAQLTTLYNAYKTSLSAYDAAVAALSPSIYYHFDETSGTDVVDYAGGNDATYSAAATPGGSPTAPWTGGNVLPLPDLVQGAGDMVVGGTGGAIVRLSRGAPGTFFHVNTSTGALEWVNAGGGTLTWPLTNTADMGFQPNSVANNTLDLHNNASAVNGVEIVGTATTVAPIIEAVGSDANVSLQIQPQGTGSVTIIGGAAASPGSALIIGGVSAAVDQITITNAATGGTVLISATGTDANVPIAIQAKGTGIVQLQPRGLNGLTVASTASAVNYLTVTPGATATGPSVSASGTDTDVALTLKTQGAGQLNLSTSAGSASLIVSGTASTIANGILVSGGIAAHGCAIGIQGSDTNVGITFNPKGTGTLVFTGGAAASPGTALTVAGVSTAVNAVTVTNAATGNSPSVAAGGSDTNVILLLQGQGTGGAAVLGTSTNDNAPTGYVGQLITSTVASSTVNLSNATPANITNISLSAGDWDVTGQVDYAPAAATTTEFQQGTSSTSATFGAQGSYSQFPVIITASSATASMPFQPVRFSLSATTTVYLVASASFSAGSITAGGTIRARRVR